jgi:dTDP-4-dehydrorhamnose 3,5-epimerase-like enzyme
MPEIKKILPAHEDQRGKIIDVVDGQEFVHSGICTFKPGVIRGNHYHKQTEQLNYLLKGKIKYSSKDLTQENAVVKEVIIVEGDMIESKPFEWHSLEAMEDSTLIFSTKKARLKGGYESDVFRIPLDKIKNHKTISI